MEWAESIASANGFTRIHMIFSKTKLDNEHDAILGGWSLFSSNELKAYGIFRDKQNKLQSINNRDWLIFQ